jgi:hypothetical protein
MTRKSISATASLTSGLAALFVVFGSPFTAQGQHEGHDQADSKLVEIVRNATQPYQNAPPSGYGAVLGCVSGSDHGAMGVHYANGSLLNGETLLSNGQLDPTRPQALIYEPQSNGEMKLVGVEFILLASALPAGAGPPEVEGHLMVFVDSPNRYGLPAFYELHVWAWRDNPQGSFVDWNNHVSCDRQ